MSLKDKLKINFKGFPFEYTQPSKESGNSSSSKNIKK